MSEKRIFSCATQPRARPLVMRSPHHIRIDLDTSVDRDGGKKVWQTRSGAAAPTHKYGRCDDGKDAIIEPIAPPQRPVRPQRIFAFFLPLKIRNRFWRNPTVRRDGRPMTLGMALVFCTVDKAGGWEGENNMCATQRRTSGWARVVCGCFS